MKIIIPQFLLCFISLISFGQDTIDVVEKTIKIGGFSKETEYFGFAEGDKVIFNLTVENRKDLKDITISEYPSNVKFADHTFDKVQNKVLNISRNGIYSFEYNNSNISGRTINVKIQRVPKTASTKFFNTNIKWVNKVDTTYSAKEISYLISSDTSMVDVIDSKVRVHSKTNMDNPNITLVDFTIPANTIKWTYWIGVGDEGEEAFQQNRAKLLKSGLKIFGSMNPLAGFALDIIVMSHAKIGDNVKYNFIATREDAQKFINRENFKLFKAGNIISDFGLMNYKTTQNETYYIGLENDNQIQGINVNVKILAVVVKNLYNKVIEKVPTYSNKLIPVIED